MWKGLYGNTDKAMGNYNRVSCSITHSSYMREILIIHYPLLFIVLIYCYLQTDFPYCSGVSICDSEKVNTSWGSPTDFHVLLKNSLKRKWK